MMWRSSYLDLTLVPLSLLVSIAYHGWLWRKVRLQPLQTAIGMNSAGRRLWVLSVMKDNDKKNILAVQTMRNAIMGSSLMATTSILLSTGLAAVISSNYSIKKPVQSFTYGANGEHIMVIKYASLLFVFVFSFLCYSFAIRFMNHANFLINIPITDDFPISQVYVCDTLEKGFILNTAGNRLFYAALPLLLWIFGPVSAFFSSIIVVYIQFKMDIVSWVGNGDDRRCWPVSGAQE